MDYRIYVVPAYLMNELTKKDVDEDGLFHYVKELASEVMMPEDYNGYGDRWPALSLLHLIMDRINNSEADQNFYFLVDEINGIILNNF